jgi:hypothetical protein
VRRHQLTLARTVLTALTLIAYAGDFYKGALVCGIAAFYSWTAR